jgi:hypothetical protein
MKTEVKDKARTIMEEADKVEFQKIVKLMIDFDERTGRHTRYPDPEVHYMRKAVSVARPESLTIKLERAEHEEGWVYFVEVILDNSSVNSLITRWIHEDGIRAERETLGEGHPVHNITCLTDLYDRA